MKTLKKYKGKITEWIVFTFIFFFLYDIIWAVADFEDFKQSIDGYYICLFVDLVYCAIFSCISLSVTKLLLRQRFVKLAEEEHSLFLRSVIVIIAINIYGHENEMYKEPMNLKRGKGVYMRELRERGGRTEDKTKCAKG